MNTPLRVLVGYASSAGSTREVAEHLAARLSDNLGRSKAGAEVVCQAVWPQLDAQNFAALIVGSAVHNMAWLPEASSFLSRLSGTHAPLWVFSVGSVEPRGPLTRMLVARERAAIEHGFPQNLDIREHRVFGGIVEMTGVPLWGRLFWRLTGGRPGDHRNWPAIDQWATHIAAELSISKSTTTPPEGTLQANPAHRG